MLETPHKANPGLSTLTKVMSIFDDFESKFTFQVACLPTYLALWEHS